MNIENADKTAPKQQIGRPFPKGVSGNPEGRPLGSLNFNTMFEEAIKRVAKDKQMNVTDVELIAVAIKKILQGDYKFYKDTMDRRFGSSDKGTEVNVAVQNITYSPEDRLLIAYELVAKENNLTIEQLKEKL
jgi:hypothetical protein